MLSPLQPYALALRDYAAGDLEAKLMLHSSLGEYDEMPLSWFFRGPDEFFPFDTAALELCSGRVLDAGAGTGVHALALQERGLEVVAIDALPEAVEVMKVRGVKDARIGDMFDVGSDQFDTILMLMNGIGPVGRLSELNRFLDRAGGMLKRGGKILVDSGEAEYQTPPPEAPVPGWPPEKPAFAGDAWIQLAYRGEWGEPFRELYLDASTLRHYVERKGWNCQLVFQDDDTSYLARLQPPR